MEINILRNLGEEDKWRVPSSGVKGRRINGVYHFQQEVRSNEAVPGLGTGSIGVITHSKVPVVCVSFKEYGSSG